MACRRRVHASKCMVRGPIKCCCLALVVARSCWLQNQKICKWVAKNLWNRVISWLRMDRMKMWTLVAIAPNSQTEHVTKPMKHGRNMSERNPDNSGCTGFLVHNSSDNRMTCPYYIEHIHTVEGPISRSRIYKPPKLLRTHAQTTTRCNVHSRLPGCLPEGPRRQENLLWKTGRRTIAI